MRRAKQKIVVIRDQFSSYTSAQFTQSESHNDLKEAIIALVTPIRHPGHIVIRTDQASGLKKIAEMKLLESANITIELGHDFNKNSNAVVDKAIQELQREITVIHPGENPIDSIILSKAVLNLNDRLRRTGNLSARNIMFSRDDKLNTNLNIQDHKLAETQLQDRQSANDRKNATNIDIENVEMGDTVMLRQNPKKHNIRDTFVVTNNAENNLTLRKISHAQNQYKRSLITNKSYRVPVHKIFKVQKSAYTYQPKVQQKSYPRFDPVRAQDSSSDDDTSDEDNITYREVVQTPETVQNVLETTQDSPDIVQQLTPPQIVHSPETVQTDYETVQTPPPAVQTIQDYSQLGARPKTTNVHERIQKQRDPKPYLYIKLAAQQTLQIERASRKRSMTEPIQTSPTGYPPPSLSKNKKMQNQAATKIQRWFKRQKPKHRYWMRRRKNLATPEIITMTKKHSLAV